MIGGMKAWDWVLAALCFAWLVALAVVATGPTGGIVKFLAQPNTPAWIQAFGVIGSIWGAFMVARRQIVDQLSAASDLRRNAERDVRVAAYQLCVIAMTRMVLTKKILSNAAKLGPSDLEISQQAIANDLRVMEAFDIRTLKSVELMQLYLGVLGTLGSMAGHLARWEAAMTGSGGGDPHHLAGVALSNIDLLIEAARKNMHLLTIRLTEIDGDGYINEAFA